MVRVWNALAASSATKAAHTRPSNRADPLQVGTDRPGIQESWPARPSPVWLECMLRRDDEGVTSTKSEMSLVPGNGTCGRNRFRPSALLSSSPNAQSPIKGRTCCYGVDGRLIPVIAEESSLTLSRTVLTTGGRCGTFSLGRRRSLPTSC